MVKIIISKIKTACSLLNKPYKLLLPAGQNGLLNFVPDRIYLKWVFKAETGYKLNLDKPQTYNEKLQWIKINDRRPEYTLYADKYRVRSYIRKTIGEEYLVPLLGVYERVEDIPWDQLPNRFVLKCNHTSGANIICTDKMKLDIASSKDRLRKWLKKNAYWGAREWCYKDIHPCIVCEQFIESLGESTPDDYKFMCFNGEPRLIQVHHDRYGDHTLDYYNPKWEKMELRRIDAQASHISIPKPDKLDDMLEIARTLSKDMNYARIDLYYSCGKIYFGEITMYPTGGFSTFSTYEDDLRLGSYITLPIDQ